MAKIEKVAGRGRPLAQINRAPYEKMTYGMIAWIAQRVSAIVLLVCVPLKIWSGWVLVGKASGPSFMAGLHTNAVLDGLLLTALVFHVLYGIRVMLIDAGLTRLADGLFVTFSILGVALVATGLYFME